MPCLLESTGGDTDTSVSGGWSFQVSSRRGSLTVVRYMASTNALKRNCVDWSSQVRREGQYAKADHRSLVVGTITLKRKRASWYFQVRRDGQCAEACYRSLVADADSNEQRRTP